jgi:hypothetical protein
MPPSFNKFSIFFICSEVTTSILQLPSREQNQIISLNASAGWIVTLYSKESILLSWQLSKRKQGTIISSRPISSMAAILHNSKSGRNQSDSLSSPSRCRDIAPGEPGMLSSFHPERVLFRPGGRWDHWPDWPLPSAAAQPNLGSRRSARRYSSTPPRNPSISSPGRKMPHLRIGNC